MPKRTLGTTLLTLDIFLFVHVLINFLLFFFNINNEHIHKCFLKSFCLLLLFHFTKFLLSFLRVSYFCGILGYNTQFNIFWENESAHVCTEISSFSSLFQKMSFTKLLYQKCCDENLTFFFVISV